MLKASHGLATYASQPPLPSKILTLNSKGSHPFWRERTVLLEGYPEHRAGWRPFHRSGIRDIYWGWRLFRKSKQFNAVFTANERASWVFALLQLLFRRRQRVLHIQIDFIWIPAQSKIREVFKRYLFSLEHRTVSKLVVFSRAQARRYAAYFPFAASKFTTIPFHPTVYNTPLETADWGYVFAGGDSARDYKSLIEAVRGLPLTLIIAAFRRDHFSLIENLPPNVDIISAEPASYIRFMARAAVVVVPMQKELFRVVGHQTYLNAMTLGKPVIVTDDSDASEYIQNGVDGFVVPPGDSPALRSVLDQLMRDSLLRERVGKAARATARKYSPEVFFERLFALAQSN